jgi:N-acetylglutamate synthase-like GNAT family acetyltransferase
LLRAGDHGENPVIEINPVSGSDPALKRLLDASGLPTDDLERPGRMFFAATANGSVCGVGGLEIAGRDILLRSLAVLPDQRCKGIGKAIIENLVDIARKRDVGNVYLLTATAAAFFENLGFRQIERAEAPKEILETRQASSLCPSSATLMKLSLAQPSNQGHSHVRASL